MKTIKEIFCSPFRKRSQDEVSEREAIVKDYFDKINFKWKDLQNLLFWETPAVSYIFFLTVTGLFWFFLLVFLKKIALLIAVVGLPMCINEIREIVLNNLIQNHGLKIVNKERHLPLGMKEVTGMIAFSWIILENHYQHIMELKELSSYKLAMWLALYISIPLIVVTYFPIASIIYAFFLSAYLYPLVTYTNILTVVQSKLHCALEPVFKHWKHSQTKRRRDTGKYATNDKIGNNIMTKSLSVEKPGEVKAIHSDHDSENDAFLPEESYYNKKMLKSAIPVLRSASSNSYHNDDISDDGSSDFDQDSFIPSEDLELDEPLPSMSQFDSMMEPLDDEFHTGLKFKDSLSSSQFGIPNSSLLPKGNSLGLTDTDTDNEIDDLPLEDTDIFVQDQGKISPKNEIGDYEMLEKSEVQNVTDEELNEHLSGINNASKNKVSSFLGY